MPAIVPIGDLKVAQKPLCYALCFIPKGDGAVLDGRMSVNCGFRWLQERTAEQLKGEVE